MHPQAPVGGCLTTYAGQMLASWLSDAPRRPSDDRAARVVLAEVEHLLHPLDGFPGPVAVICFAILRAIRSALRAGGGGESVLTLAEYVTGDVAGDALRQAVRREVVGRGGERVGDADAIAAACCRVLSGVRAAFPADVAMPLIAA